MAKWAVQETPGQRIEALALERGLPSGGKLAELLGVSFETLRQWRVGQSAPNRSRQAHIAKVLGVPPEAFMHGVVGASGPAKENPPWPFLRITPEQWEALGDLRHAVEEVAYRKAMQLLDDLSVVRKHTSGG